MELGSDGSLCPITCSAAEHNNAVVVPESESEKSKRPPYKILFLGIIQNPYESSSETESDEEICKKVPENVESNINNEGNTNTSSDKKTSGNKAKDKRSAKADKIYNKQIPKSFKSRRPKNQYNRFKNPRNSLYKRNSYPQNGSGTIYSNTSSTNIDPWAINPNQVMLPNYQYSVYPQFPVSPAIEPHIPKNINTESSAKSVGLLGTSPYENYQFPPPKQNVPDQNYWSDTTNMHDQNYWSNSHYDSYPRSVSKTNYQHRKTYQQNGYRQWENRRGNSHKWNKTKDPKDRGMQAAHYTYDH